MPLSSLWWWWTWASVKTNFLLYLVTKQGIFSISLPTTVFWIHAYYPCPELSRQIPQSFYPLWSAISVDEDPMHAVELKIKPEQSQFDLICKNVTAKAAASQVILALIVTFLLLAKEPHWLWNIHCHKHLVGFSECVCQLNRGIMIPIS